MSCISILKMSDTYINQTRTHLNMKKRSNIKPLNKKENKNISLECMCCMTNNSNYVTCVSLISHNNTNSHVTCHDCIKKYIETIINEKKRFTCVYGQDCKNTYKNQDIITAIGSDTKLLEKYKEYRDIDATANIASFLDNYHICPFCSKYGIIVDNDNDEILVVNCENVECKKSWCILCRNEAHGNNNCNIIKKYDLKIIDKTINRVIDNATLHKCPKCYTRYNKEEGCNLITCPSCHTYSCYLCGEIITPNDGKKYEHFDKSECTVYNGDEYDNDDDIINENKKLNRTKIEDALRDLIKINYDNPKIRDTLIKNIKNRGYNVDTEILRKIKLLEIMAFIVDDIEVSDGSDKDEDEDDDNDDDDDDCFDNDNSNERENDRDFFNEIDI